ncbi:hypothetical protein [Listeria booriae]|uniref:hypothetical protein n=1 Tax=Listeria booriae TaxID=1552123 RepID=UPI00164D2DEE|nr:hypothetical protein [Listeria booriae]MBC6301333.1 hypothetical protein [Listeria booriae]
MKLFGKKNETKLDQLDQAEKAVNKGLTGLLTKAFVGKEQMDKINSSIQNAKNATLASEGAIPEVATATVTAIQDTGQLVNYDPMVILQLNVVEPGREPYAYRMQTLVSKLQIPRVGDVIRLGANPADASQFVYLGICG